MISWMRSCNQHEGTVTVVVDEGHVCMDMSLQPDEMLVVTSSLQQAVVLRCWSTSSVMLS